MNWVYRKEEDGAYLVGYYVPWTGAFVGMRQYAEEEKAVRLVNYLNGGDGRGVIISGLL
jgi:hypothetical protein